MKQDGTDWSSCSVGYKSVTTTFPVAGLTPIHSVTISLVADHRLPNA